LLCRNKKQQNFSPKTKKKKSRNREKKEYANKKAILRRLSRFFVKIFCIPKKFYKNPLGLDLYCRYAKIAKFAYFFFFGQKSLKSPFCQIAKSPKWQFDNLAKS